MLIGPKKYFLENFEHASCSSKLVIGSGIGVTFRVTLSCHKLIPHPCANENFGPSELYQKLGLTTKLWFSQPHAASIGVTAALLAQNWARLGTM